jgi:hypothetical protein
MEKQNINRSSACQLTDTQSRNSAPSRVSPTFCVIKLCGSCWFNDKMSLGIREKPNQLRPLELDTTTCPARYSLHPIHKILYPTF